MRSACEFMHGTIHFMCLCVVFVQVCVQGMHDRCPISNIIETESRHHILIYTINSFLMSGFKNTEQLSIQKLKKMAHEY